MSKRDHSPRNLPVQNKVAIGGTDSSVIDKIAKAVSEQNMGLGTILFSSRTPYASALQYTQAQTPRVKGWVPLIIICPDKPRRVYSLTRGVVAETPTDFLKMAQDLAKKKTLVVVGVSSSAELRKNLIEAGCVAAMTLEELLAAIPTQLESWLIYRK
jgi:hypothetical protein